jgi:hypothetical protein
MGLLHSTLADGYEDVLTTDLLSLTGVTATPFERFVSDFSARFALDPAVPPSQQTRRGDWAISPRLEAMSQRLEQGQAGERLVAGRLTLRRPRTADTAAIRHSYSGTRRGPDVTRLLAWPRHRSIDGTLSFIKWSDQACSSAPAGLGLSRS